MKLQQLLMIILICFNSYVFCILYWEDNLKIEFNANCKLYESDVQKIDCDYDYKENENVLHSSSFTKLSFILNKKAYIELGNRSNKIDFTILIWNVDFENPTFEFQIKDYNNKISTLPCVIYDINDDFENLGGTRKIKTFKLSI